MFVLSCRLYRLNSRNGREFAEEEEREVVLSVLGVDRARVTDPLPTITHIVDDIESVLDERLGPIIKVVHTNVLDKLIDFE
jgi:hypothetical protein